MKRNKKSIWQVSVSQKFGRNWQDYEEIHKGSNDLTSFTAELKNSLLRETLKGVACSDVMIKSANIICELT